MTLPDSWGNMRNKSQQAQQAATRNATARNTVPRQESSTGLNAELINDRVKLLFHRLIARRLGQDPSLIELARQELARVREQREERTYMKEWDEILRLDVETPRRVIVRRDERMTRLRISSPMGPLIDVRDLELRRRIWRNARRALSLGRTSSEKPSY
jgi:hypothetical protein